MANSTNHAAGNNQYAAVYAKQTVIIHALDSTKARTQAAIKLGVPKSNEWRIKLHCINSRVPIKFKPKKK